MNKANFLLFVAALFLALLPFRSQAVQSQDFGEFIVHYNALTTDMLPPPVASAYNIQRSGNVVMLNITVLREVLGTPGTPVEAKVDASAVNLTNQHHNVDMREIKEENAIYYIGTLGVDNLETYDFTILVTPKGQNDPFVVKFQQQFFTE